MEDGGSNRQRPGVATQEGDVMATRQAVQVPPHRVQRLGQEGGVAEHIVKVEVEQRDS